MEILNFIPRSILKDPIYYLGDGNLHRQKGGDEEFQDAIEKCLKEAPHASYSVLYYEKEQPMDLEINKSTASPFIGDEILVHCREIEDNKYNMCAYRYIKRGVKSTSVIVKQSTTFCLDDGTYSVEATTVESKTRHAKKYTPMLHVNNITGTPIFGNEADTNEKQAVLTESVYEENKNMLITLGVFFQLLEEKDVVLSKNKVSFKPPKATLRQSCDVTYISTKRYLSNPSCNGKMRKMEWSHSWIVRGHWRYKEGLLGKDRSGVRNQIGRTWVTEATKKKDLPFKEKMRVVK